MYRYVGNISDLSHDIIKNYVLNKDVAVDATLGNGYDTDFLAELFSKVYAFDIQEEPCIKYKEKNIVNVEVINDSHHLFNTYINTKVDCIIYNLGFLPGGDKSITTNHITSLESIKLGLELLNSGGMMVICIYRGHNEGKVEETCILQYLKELPKNKYGVMVQSYLNRQDISPMMVIVEKK